MYFCLSVVCIISHEHSKAAMAVGECASNVNAQLKEKSPSFICVHTLFIYLSINLHIYISVFFSLPFTANTPGLGKDLKLCYKHEWQTNYAQCKKKKKTLCDALAVRSQPVLKRYTCDGRIPPQTSALSSL